MTELLERLSREIIIESQCEEFPYNKVDIVYCESEDSYVVYANELSVAEFRIESGSLNFVNLYETDKNALTVINKNRSAFLEKNQ